MFYKNIFPFALCFTDTSFYFILRKLDRTSESISPSFNVFDKVIC